MKDLILMVFTAVFLSDYLYCYISGSAELVIQGRLWITSSAEPDIVHLFSAIAGYYLN